MPNLKPLSHAVNQMWDLQATMNVLRSDKNFDGKLNPEEYKKVALVQGDGFFASRARDYEFAVVDEIKLPDGQVSITELASFYQSLDADKNGSHSAPEVENRLNQSTWLTRVKHPIASFSNLIGQYARSVKDVLN